MSDKEMFFDVGDFEARLKSIDLTGKRVVLVEVAGENRPQAEWESLLKNVESNVRPSIEKVCGKDDVVVLTTLRGYIDLKALSDEKLKDLGLQRIPNEVQGNQEN